MLTETTKLMALTGGKVLKAEIKAGPVGIDFIQCYPYKTQSQPSPSQIYFLGMPSAIWWQSDEETGLAILHPQKGWILFTSPKRELVIGYEALLDAGYDEIFSVTISTEGIKIISLKDEELSEKALDLSHLKISVLDALKRLESN